MKLFGPSGGDVVFLLEALSERILHSEHAMTISNIASAMYGFKVIRIFYNMLIRVTYIRFCYFCLSVLDGNLTISAVSEYE